MPPASAGGPRPPLSRRTGTRSRVRPRGSPRDSGACLAPPVQSHRSHDGPTPPPAALGAAPARPRCHRRRVRAAGPVGGHRRGHRGRRRGRRRLAHRLAGRTVARPRRRGPPRTQGSRGPHPPRRARLAGRRQSAPVPANPAATCPAAGPDVPAAGPQRRAASPGIRQPRLRPRRREPRPPAASAHAGDRVPDPPVPPAGADHAGPRRRGARARPRVRAAPGPDPRRPQRGPRRRARDPAAGARGDAPHRHRDARAPDRRARWPA